MNLIVDVTTILYIWMIKILPLLRRQLVRTTSLFYLLIDVLPFCMANHDSNRNRIEFEDVRYRKAMIPVDEQKFAITSDRDGYIRL